MCWFGEGKKLSTEDIFLLYLGTIAGELKEMRTEMARLEDKIDKTNQRIDETNKRIDEVVKNLSTRIDVAKTLTTIEIDRRIDTLQTILLQKLLTELLRKQQ